MYLAHIFSGHSGPSSLGNLAHLDGLNLNAGPTRFTTPGPTRPASNGRRAGATVSNARQVQLEQRHAARLSADEADIWRRRQRLERQRHEER